MQLPAQIGDYTDFYASIDHATRVGKLFRPDNPLLPNYKYVPIGYHGRASSIVVSGQEIRRPSRPDKGAAAASQSSGRRRSLDYELEVGVFVGPGNTHGESNSDRPGRGAHLRPVPPERLVCARYSVVGISASGSVSREELRDVDFTMDRADGGSCAVQSSAG